MAVVHSSLKGNPGTLALKAPFPSQNLLLMFSYPVLISDIGGTNARFAIVPAPGRPYIPLPRMLTAEAATPVEAFLAVLKRTDAPEPRSAMIALANRVDDLVVPLTNAPWILDAAALGSALNLDRVTLVNDYTPVAASLTALNAQQGDLALLGGRQDDPTGPRIVLGPGTGFGAAVLVPFEDKQAILATEAGHIEFGPANAEERALFDHVEPVLGRVTSETLLSGPGLLRIVIALAKVKGMDMPFTAPNDILLAGAQNPLAQEAITVFTRLLGRFSGDLALLFEATGGVFIAGGLVPKMISTLRNGEFRKAFDAKAPHDAWARQVPTSIILHPDPALLGLSVLCANPSGFVFPSQSWTA